MARFRIGWFERSKRVYLFTSSLRTINLQRHKERLTGAEFGNYEILEAFAVTYRMWPNNERAFERQSDSHCINHFYNFNQFNLIEDEHSN